MQTILFNILVNALWQATLVLVCAILAARLVRRNGPATEHRVWVGALLLQVALPVMSLVNGTAFWRSAQTLLSDLLRKATIGGGHGISIRIDQVAPHANSAWWSGCVHWIAIGYGVVLATALLRLAIRIARTVNLVRRSRVLPSAEALPHSQAEAVIGVSRDIASPVALQLHENIVLIPLHWRRKLSAEDVDAAIAHEAAHLERNDFFKNLAYELLACPLAFHPAMWMTRRRLAETREMICDDTAARQQPNARSYARSLLRLANAAMELRPTATQHYGIGVFDAGTLERRIMQLTQHVTPPRTGRRALQTVAVAALFVTTAGSAVALALRIDGPDAVHAQNPSTTGPLQQVDPGQMASNLLTRVNPVYPPIAKAKKLNDEVVLKAIIGKDGHMKSLQVLSGQPMFTTAAMEAVRQWVYKPYLNHGEATEVETRISVNFQIF